MAKRGVLLFLVLISALFFWASTDRWIQNPVWSLADVSPWLVPMISLVVLAAMLGIAFMLIPDYWLKVSASVLSAVPFIIIFGIAPIYFGAALVMVALHLNAIARISDELNSRIKMTAKHIVRRGIGMIILPHLLLISFAYYQTPAVKNAGKDFKLPSAISGAIESTTQTFLGPQLQELPLAERKRVESQIVNQTIHKFTDIARPYFKYLPPVLAFGLFLALQGLSPIFFELGSFLALFVFLVLKNSGFVVVVEKDVRAERLII